MSRCFLFCLLMQVFIIKSTASHGQPVTKYVHVTGVGPHSPPRKSLPPASSNYQPTQRNTGPPTDWTLALAGIPTSPSLPSTSPPIKPPPLPKSPEISAPSGLDSNVLNNLAIALQLLIVSNILNTPAPEPSILEPGLPTLPYELPQAISYSTEVPLPYAIESCPSYGIESAKQSQPYISSYESPLPNANFLGSSTFAEPAMLTGVASGSSRPSSRSNIALMSPYEALASNPYTDPILSSSYGSYSKKDFQSPYSAILAADMNRDLFSFSDFY